MTEPVKDAIAADVAELMTRYSFDLGGYPLEQWIEQWISQYVPTWLPIAVIEALYQGRYKAVSIWQILDLWRRRGKPLQHFNREFERMVSGRAIQLLFTPTAPQSVITVVEPLLVTAKVNGHRAWGSAAELPHRAHPAYGSPGHSYPNLSSSSVAKIALTAATESGASPLSSPEQFPHATAAKTPIQTFKPSEQVKLVLPGEMARLRSAQYPIRQFVPASDSSEFHSKLKSIVQVLSFAQAQTLAKRLTAETPLEQQPELPQPELPQTEYEQPELQQTEYEQLEGRSADHDLVEPVPEADLDLEPNEELSYPEQTHPDQSHPNQVDS